MKTTITDRERLQLIGLLTLADQCDRRMHAVIDGLEALLGVTLADKDGILNVRADHISDAVWDRSRRDADRLLERLGIAVVSEAAANVPARDGGDAYLPGH